MRYSWPSCGHSTDPMAKRRLSEQQQRRIRQRHRDQRAQARGEGATDIERAPQTGLVIAQFGRLVLVANPPFGADSRLVRCQDRKSTRLNSSHVAISYAVFCLTKYK